jgi:mono/diheme cytochrome c family protein
MELAGCRKDRPRRGGCVALAVCVALALIGCKGKYIRATTVEKFEATPERLQRGQYLVNQAMGCGGCHTSRATGNLFLEGEQTDLFLAGGNVLEDPGTGKFYIPNLTPDPEGLGSWTDEEVLRAVRDGVDKNGRFLAPMMPYNNYQHLSDEDGKSLVAYLRSIPAAKSPRPRFENEIKFIPKVLFTVIGVQMHTPTVNVLTPDRADAVAYGHYLARISGCTDCHSLGQRGPKKEDDPMFMAGSEIPFVDARLGKVYSRNLTPDLETGIGKYKAADLKASIRTGKRLDGKRMAPPMSVMIPHYSGMTEQDLDALVAYLGTLKPAKHVVAEPELTPEAQKLVAPEPEETAKKAQNLMPTLENQKPVTP